MSGRHRADARRNSEAVVEAAAIVFAEQGLDAGVPEIAARAGVGKATVYRCFPTKELLIGAVVIERLRWWEQRTREAAAAEDPWEAFVELLLDSAERQCTDRALSGGIVHDLTLPEVVEAREATTIALGELLERAKATGRMRQDATPEDVRVLFVGATQVLATDAERDVAVWRRAAALVADAFRI